MEMYIYPNWFPVSVEILEDQADDTVNDGHTPDHQYIIHRVQ